MISFVKNNITEKLDLVVSSAGIFVGLLILSLYLISPTIHLLLLGTALFLASIVYLGTRNIPEKHDMLAEKKIVKKSADIAFFIFFSLSLVALHGGENRSLYYFILVSLCSGCLALSVNFIQSKSDIYFEFVKIFALSINAVSSVFLQFKGSGVDYWAHLVMNNLLSQVGNTNVLYDKEPFFPLMHIQVSVTQLVSALPVKEATFFSVILPLVLSLVCVFLIGRKLFDVKTGLLAMLILAITDYFLLWGIQPQTTSFGLCLYYFLVYLLLQTYFETRKNVWVILSLFLITSLILTHAVASFILLVTITGLFLGTIIYYLLFREKPAYFLPTIISVYTLGLILHWFVALYNKEGEKTFFDRITESLNYYLTGYADFLNRPEAAVDYIQHLPPFIERIADIMGLTLIIFFSIIGCLFWLSSQYRNVKTFALIICSMVLLAITFVFPLFGIRNILPTRWFAFIYLLLSIMAAFALIHISLKFRNEKVSYGFLVLFIILISFFMISCTISNQDSPLWLKTSTISTTYSSQEYIGAETLKRSGGDMYSDLRYSSSILRECLQIDNNAVQSLEEIGEGEQRIFLLRSTTLIQPIRVMEKIKGYYERVAMSKKIDSGIVRNLENQDKMYVNGRITGYYNQN